MIDLLLSSFLLLLLGVLTSCQSQEEDIKPSDLTGRWQLVSIVHTSMVAGQPDASENPPYQELLLLDSDNTFKRSRSTGYEATGTYRAQQYDKGDRGVLLHFENGELSYHQLSGNRVNSYQRGEVYLRQEQPDVLVESYKASDGPSFIYHRVKTAE